MVFIHVLTILKDISCWEHFIKKGFNSLHFIYS